MTTPKARALICVVPLLFGGAIYVLWRSPSLLMFRWFRWLGVAEPINALRQFAASFGEHLPEWLVYSLPDAAWVSTGVLLFAAIWHGSESPVRHFWVLLAPALALGGEFAQFLHILPGTFDQFDLIICSAVACLSLYVAQRFFAYAL